MSDRVYNASITAKKFFRNDEFFRLLVGPIGSGKSVACVIEILRRCKEQVVGADGFRRSRWAVVRNSVPQLKDTTLKTWMDWIPPGQAGRWKETEKVFYLEFGDVRAEILFRPLDSPDDVQRVLSLELTGAWLNEAREIPREIVEAIQGRLGRFPAGGGGGWFGLIADTNPPEIDSYWYKLAEGVPIDEKDPSSVMPCAAFRQPSGLSPLAENVENLPPDYYGRLSTGRSKDWIDTYVHGMYSPSLSGIPVYQKQFRMDKHISKTRLEPDAALPVIIGFDFGRTPACVFKQVTMDGRIHTLRELTSFDMGLETFIRRLLRPMIRNVFPGNPLIFITDPAGIRRNDTDDGSCVKLLRDSFKAEGAWVKPAVTNDPLVRIAATERTLTQYPDGEPMALYDPACKMLIEGLRSKYRYKLQNNRDLSHGDKPEKNDWSHVVEANQYGDLFIIGGKYDAADFTRFSMQGSTVIAAPARPALYTGY